MELSGVHFLVTCSMLHLSGWKDSHCARLTRFHWRFMQFSIVCIFQYTMQSSANSLVLDVTQSGRSLMNNRKKRGPSTVLWGTPLMTGAFSDVAPSTMTCCVWPGRNDMINPCVWPLIPLWLSFFRSLRCGTWSKALEKSRVTRSINPSLLWCLSGFSIFWYLPQNKEKPLIQQRKLGLKVHLPSWILHLSKLEHQRQQLSLAAAAATLGSETVLTICQNLVMFQMAQEVAGDYILLELERL